MTQSDSLSGNTTPVWSTTMPLSSTTIGIVDDSKEKPVDDPNRRPMLTDTLAAVTIAILAVILIITLTLIIRAVRRRQRFERGEELDHIPTVSSGIMGAHVAAYRRGQRAAREERGVISWEPVDSASSSNANGATATSPSPSGTTPSNC